MPPEVGARTFDLLRTPPVGKQIPELGARSAEHCESQMEKFIEPIEGDEIRFTDGGAPT
jgi:hypothetical protein